MGGRDDGYLVLVEMQGLGKTIHAILPGGGGRFLAWVILKPKFPHLQANPLNDAEATSGSLYRNAQGFLLAWEERILHKVKPECLDVVGEQFNVQIVSVNNLLP